MITGITYEYAIDDDYYDDYKTALKETLSDLTGYYNTLRIYNINPDNSYDKFMSLCDELGVYVIVSGVPANEAYFGEFRYTTMRKDLGPSEDDTCYPVKLLYFGKKVAKIFAAYDNTLSILVANEIMQTDLTAAACVKQYVSDLKTWMTTYSSYMRILPLSYAAADSSNTDLGLTANEYGPMKIQGLLCGDSMSDGRMKSSIDIFFLNEYRWCPGNTFEASYSNIFKWSKGVPIVMGMGEYGCKESSSDTREWGMVPYLIGDNSTSEGFTDVFSGGHAYSFGEAMLSSSSLYPIFTGGSTDITGTPSSESSDDYTYLKQKFKKYFETNEEKASWTSDTVCSWTPDLTYSVPSTNEQVYESGWIVDDCSDIPNGDDATWTTSTRDGEICNDEGGTCDVTLSSSVGTTEEDICGYSISIDSGGGSCTDSSDCSSHGTCTGSDGNKTCACYSCYTGSTCSTKDVSLCSKLSSSSDAPTKIAVGTGVFLAVMIVAMTTLGVLSYKQNSAISQHSQSILSRGNGQSV